MAIKVQNSSSKKPLSAPKPRVGNPRKPASLRPFPRLPLGQCWPRHWPTPRGPKFPNPWAILGPPGTDFAPLHGKPPCSELGPQLNIREVAELIGCSPWTVRQTLMPRGLPHFRSAASGRLIFYTNQIVDWIESQQFQGGITTK